MSSAPTVRTGGCHCGDVRFEVRGALSRVLACNCSICSKKGFLHWIVAEADFTLLTDPRALSTYTFGTHTAKHMFCRRCGISAFYRPRSHPDGYSVNARCVDDVDLDGLTVQPFDGQNWEAHIDDINPALRDRADRAPSG
jgi:hypothetical protein